MHNFKPIRNANFRIAGAEGGKVDRSWTDWRLLLLLRDSDNQTESVPSTNDAKAAVTKYAVRSVINNNPSVENYFLNILIIPGFYSLFTLMNEDGQYRIAAPVGETQKEEMQRLVKVVSLYLISDANSSAPADVDWRSSSVALDKGASSL